MPTAGGGPQGGADSLILGGAAGGDRDTEGEMSIVTVFEIHGDPDQILAEMDGAVDEE